MKSYIRGVGSGLPIVKEYLDFTHGTISIEDNLGTGSVVTISANGSNPQLPKELEIDHAEDEDAEHPEPTAPRYRIAEESREPTGLNAQPAYAQPSAQYTHRRGLRPSRLCRHTSRLRRWHMQPRNSSRNLDTRRLLSKATCRHPFQQPMGYPYGQQMQQQPQSRPAPVDAQPSSRPCPRREKDFLVIYLKEGVLGVSDVVELTERRSRACITR